MRLLLLVPLLLTIMVVVLWLVTRRRDMVEQPAPDMSFTQLLLPTEQPSVAPCLPFENVLRIDGCPVVLR